MSVTDASPVRAVAGPGNDDDARVPELPTGVITLEAPPERIEAGGAGSVLASIIPMFGTVGVMVFMALGTKSASGGYNTSMLLMGGGMAVAMLSMVGFNVYRGIASHRQKVSLSRREYLAYLAEMRTTVRTAARRQRRYTSWFLPDPDTLVLVASEGSRVWEREPSGDEALHVRLGTSTQDLSMLLQEPDLPPLADPDPVCLSAMNRFVSAHSAVDDMPFGVALSEYSHIEVAGAPESTRAEVRAMIAHLATFTPPAGLMVAVLCSEAVRPQWEWLKWLPQNRSHTVTDAVGPARIVASDATELVDLIGAEVTSREAFRPRRLAPSTPWPHLLLIVDDMALPANTRLGSVEGTAGVTVVSMPSTWGPLTSRTTLRLVLHPGTRDQPRGAMQLVLLDQAPIIARPDLMSLETAEAVARQLTAASDVVDAAAARTDTSPAGRSDPRRTVDLMELLGIGDIRDFDPERQWTRREGRDRLRVPFAVTPEGVPVQLDIKESAQDGMGPHGLLIGATGSGKSEVLRTLVLALTLTHSPEQLNLVLVDFKGGATFAGMADLPHVSAMISNLESELSLVDRMQDALRGEMVRRQELLRKAGNYANVTDYEADRLAGRHHEPPLPALFIVLDEFSELLSAKPEFIDLFVAIGRLGRSMSIHLLLASQRLEEGRLRGLDSHLSYRVGLRTFSSSESRSVLGVPDAYELPSLPGSGYLKASTDSMTRFRASYVAAPPPPRKAGQVPISSIGGTRQVTVLPFTSRMVLTSSAAELTAAPEPASDTAATTVLPGDDQWAGMSEIDIAVARMRGKGTPAHQVWLPPLDVPDTFDQLMPDLAVDPQLGLVSRQWRSQGPLRIPLGTTDVPLEQRREPLVFDFSGAGGHMAVIGGPLSGKSTTLRSVVTALSLTHTPQEVHFYVLDFGGGTFAPYEGAAHIAGVATRDRPDEVNRVVAEIEGIVADRERYFRAHRIDSITTYRAGRAEGRFDDGYGDVFLVVDGWGTIRSDFDELEMRLQVLSARALTFGVHLVLSASRWMDLRQQIRDVIGSRLELRLGDPSDSEINRRVAPLVPEGRPGRGLESGQHHVLVALPRADADPNPATLAQGVRSTLDAIADAWHGPAGPKLRLLPERIDLDAIRAMVPDSPALLLGIEESRLGPLVFDPASESHMFLLGDAKSGKSTFLRTMAREIMRTRTPDDAQIFMVDYRRALLGEVPEEYLAGYCTTRDDAQGTLADVADYLATRLPTDAVTPEQLRNRSWWTGAEAWVLVDDYDLVATQMGNPVAALQPLMSQAQDIGLHIVAARRMGGAARALYEPVIQTMTELGSTSILLSGNPDEGPIIGRIKPMRTDPGRAQVISRDAGRLVAQLAWTPPAL